MFTGLVEAMGHVTACEVEGPGRRLAVECEQVATDAQIGDSIAVNGCCLTVIHKQDGTLSFQAGEETLLKTNLGELKTGSGVNLERSLRIGDRLGGHFVTGHVDGIGQLDARIDDGEWSTCWFRLPEELAPCLVPKGCVAVDGVSLTVVNVEEARFSVALIPHTLEHTTLGARHSGDPVNLETDLLAKYVQRQTRA